MIYITTLNLDIYLPFHHDIPMLDMVKKRFKTSRKKGTTSPLKSPAGQNESKNSLGKPSFRSKGLSEILSGNQRESSGSAEKKRCVYILSIDGGGIRGIIPAMVLQELEQLILEKQDTTKLCNLFDLIAGTESGALTALGLSASVTSPVTTFDLHRPFTAREIIETYKALGKEVFPSGKFRIIGQAFTGKYSATPLEKFLKTTFGDKTQKDLLTNLLITAYDNERKRPHLFINSLNTGVGATSSKAGSMAELSSKLRSKSQPPTKSKTLPTPKDLNFALHHMGRAATAVPTYFSSALISDTTGANRFSLCDGSVYANNPAIIAYSRALELYPQAEEFHLLSLGTAPKRMEFSHKKIRDWGFLDWLNPAKGMPLYDLHSHAQEGIIDYYAEHLPKLHYYRITMDQQESHIGIDSATSEHIQQIEQLGLKLIEKEGKVLKDFVEAL